MASDMTRLKLKHSPALVAPLKLGPNIRKMLTIVLCFLAIGGVSNAIQSFKPFNDALTLNPHFRKSSQTVEHLGRIIKLTDSAGKYNAFPCTFSIQTRSGGTNVTFSPEGYCDKGGLCKYHKYDLKKLDASGYDPDRRTIIIIPGYMTETTTDWQDKIARLWLQIEDVNVIKVGWVEGNRYLYMTAVSGTPIVAREITILLHHLAAMHGLEFTDEQFAMRTQIVGHSLGAHIAAFVGQDLGGRLGRITGLDPAGRFFDQQPREHRLDPTDARLVDVIHTNSGKFHYTNLAASCVQAGLDWCLHKVPGVNKLYSSSKSTLGEGYNREANTSWFGIDQQVGHVDFYANNGRVQPGCESYLHLDDHGRACDIYADFLTYELLSKRRYDHLGHKENRLLAFKSDDYDSFLVGTSLATKCPAILDNDPQARQGLRESMKHCSLPMDFTGSTGELIQEYANDYGVKFLEGPDKELYGKVPGVNYYFSTRGQSPLVGDHYMLKISPHYSDFNWSPKCSLEAEIGLTNRNGITKINLFLLEDKTKPVGINHIIGGPMVYTALFTVPPFRTLGGGIDRILPQSIRLSVSSVEKSPSAAKAVAAKVLGLFSLKSSKAKCNMVVESVEIIQLLGSDRALVRRFRGKGSLGIDDELQLANFHKISED